jgi:hypothetical protein
MKTRFVLALLGVSSLALVLNTGCVATPPPGTVYVSAAPPAAVVEIQGIAPGPEFFWIPGFHRWDGGRHVWVSGHWERRPHATAVWEPGVWRHHSRGWYWIDGRWR